MKKKTNYEETLQELLSTIEKWVRENFKSGDYLEIAPGPNAFFAHRVSTPKKPKRPDRRRTATYKG